MHLSKKKLKNSGPVIIIFKKNQKKCVFENQLCSICEPRQRGRIMRNKKMRLSLRRDSTKQRAQNYFGPVVTF